MGNMSYCRFHNTLIDLQDCYNALRDNETLSKSEFEARQALIKMCFEIAADVDVYLAETFEDHCENSRDEDLEDE